MSNKSIVITSDDAPTYRELIDTVSRLRKDYKLLSRVRGTKDQEDPNSILNVASFLEMLAQREKRKLRKDESITKSSHDVLIQMLCDALSEMSDSELKQTIKETGLSNIFRKELFND